MEEPKGMRYTNRGRPPEGKRYQRPPIAAGESLWENFNYRALLIEMDKTAVRQAIEEVKVYVAVTGKPLVVKDTISEMLKVTGPKNTETRDW